MAQLIHKFLLQCCVLNCVNLIFHLLFFCLWSFKNCVVCIVHLLIAIIIFYKTRPQSCKHLCICLTSFMRSALIGATIYHMHKRLQDWDVMLQYRSQCCKHLGAYLTTHINSSIDISGTTCVKLSTYISAFRIGSSWKISLGVCLHL